MMKDLSKAKKMYFYYACNHYYMFRDGIDKEYLSYSVPKNLEIEWKEEYISTHLEHLNGNNLEALDALSHCHAEKALPEIIKYSMDGDSFEKLWFAITLFSFSNQRNEKKYRDVRDHATRICEDLIKNPKVISAQCKKRIGRDSIKALKANSHEEYISNYAKNLINEHVKSTGIKKFLSKFINKKAEE